MKSLVLSAMLLGLPVGFVAAQDAGPAESGAAESVEPDLAQLCADAGVDITKPESEMSRSERRAFRQCRRDAARLVARSDEADEDEDIGLICRRESVVGTHRRVRICTTREQRDAMREASVEAIRNITRPGGQAQ